MQTDPFEVIPSLPLQIKCWKLVDENLGSLTSYL